MSEIISNQTNFTVPDSFQKVPEMENPENSNKKENLRFIRMVILIFAIIFIIKVLFPASVVSGHSMMPTLKNGEYLIGERVLQSTKLNYGDVITFKTQGASGDEEIYIKRVIGLPGDGVVIKDGKVYINGKLSGQDGTYNDKRLGKTEYAGTAENGIILGNDEYFVLGDNRGNSRDSRYIGPVKKDVIETKIILPAGLKNK